MERVEHESAVGAWLWPVLLPAFWTLGYAAARLPAVLWPQYAAMTHAQPKWFALAGTSLFLLIVESGGALAMTSAMNRARNGSRSDVIALAVSGAFMLLSASVLLTSLAVQWADRC